MAPLQAQPSGVWTPLAWVHRGESLKDFLAVLCGWFRPPCWFSLVPVCVQSAQPVCSDMTTRVAKPAGVTPALLQTARVSSTSSSQLNNLTTLIWEFQTLEALFDLCVQVL